MSQDPYWKAIDDLRQRQAIQSERLAVLEAQVDSISASQSRIEGLLLSIHADLTMVKKDLDQAKGGIAFGKWLAGITVALISTGLLIIKWGSGE